MLDNLELKVQEPCTRVALKVVHQSLVYLAEISEIFPAAQNQSKPPDLSCKSFRPSRGQSSITGNRYSSVCMGGSTCCRRGAL